MSEVEHYPQLKITQPITNCEHLCWIKTKKGGGKYTQKLPILLGLREVRGWQGCSRGGRRSLKQTGGATR